MISVILHCSGMTLRRTKLLSPSYSKQISFFPKVFIYLFLILAAYLFNQEFNLKIFLTSKRGLSLADFDLGLKTGKIPPSIRASQTIAELCRRDSEELQIHEMFENGCWKTLSLTYVSFYTLSAIAYFTVLEIQKLHHSFRHCSFA